jgi:hypothetical protein
MTPEQRNRLASYSHMAIGAFVVSVPVALILALIVWVLL